MADSPTERTLTIKFVGDVSDPNRKLDELERRAGRGVGTGGGGGGSAGPVTIIDDTGVGGGGGSGGRVGITRERGGATWDRLPTGGSKADYAERQRILAERAAEREARAAERAAAAEERRARAIEARVERNWDAAGLARQRQEERAAAASGGGLSMGRLAYVTTVGYLARQGLSIAQGMVAMNNANSLAGKDQAAQLEATQQFSRQVEGIPILGQLAAILSDPSGKAQLGIDRTMKETGLTEQMTAASAARGQFTQSLTEQASLAGERGWGRRRAEAELQFQATMRTSRGHRNDQNQIQQQLFDQQAAAIQEDYGERIKGYGPDGASSEQLASAAAVRQAALVNLNRQRASWAARLGAAGTRDETSAAAVRNDQLIEYNAFLRGNDIETRGANQRAAQNDEAGLTVQKLRNEQRENLESDGGARDSMARLHRAEENATQAEIQRARDTRGIGRAASIAAARARANRDPYTAQMAELEAAGNAAIIAAPEAEKAAARAVGNANLASAHNTALNQLQIQQVAAETRNAQLAQSVGGNRLAAELAGIAGQRQQYLLAMPKYGPNHPLAAQYDAARSAAMQGFDLEEQLARKQDTNGRWRVTQGLTNDVEGEKMRSEGRDKSARAQEIRAAAQMAAENFRREGGPDAEKNAQLATQRGRYQLLDYERQLKLQQLGNPISNEGIAAGGIGGGATGGRINVEKLDQGLTSVREAIKQLERSLTGGGN